MRIIVDTLGADKGYEEIVKGTLQVMKTRDIEVLFVGNAENIKKLVEGSSVDPARIDYIQTDEYIMNNEDPVISIRRKKDASIVLGLNALKEGRGDGFISAGSTGALLAGGLLITKRIDNIDRAALTIVLPSPNGGTVLLDAGANMDTTPEYLRQFAAMGSIYASKVLKRENPRVALLNVGSEEGKGDKRTKESYDLLKASDLNFVGNVESRDLLSGNCDVIVCDGFAGNIALKAFEGVATVVMKSIKEGIMASPRTKLGGILVKPALSGLKKTFDYNEYGAAPLLGTRQPVFKAHGSSNSRALETGIEALVKFIENDVIQYITQDASSIGKANKAEG